MMRLVPLFLMIFLLSPLASWAGHILGGDMSVQHLEDDMFSVRLQLFRDCNSGAAELDVSLIVFVYEQGTDVLMEELTFDMSLNDQYEQELGDECFTPSICLEIGTYEQEVILPANPNGYYLVWERCCRSISITNLADTETLGIVFVASVPDPALENSSPQFGDYPTDGYFCVSSTNQFSYAATDADGDSLVYILEPPIYGLLATFDLPSPGGGGPEPTFQQFDYLPPFSEADPIGGPTPLSIDSETGLITASPDLLGYFSFAVRVDEYRDGGKIGEIRREITLESTLCNADVPPDFAGFDTYDTLYLTAFFDNEIPIVINDNSTDTVWQTFGGDIFDQTLYDNPAVYDTIAVQDGLFSGVLHWNDLGCEYVSEDAYEVVFVANSIHECTGEPSSDTLFLALYVQLPEDVPTLLTEPYDLDYLFLVTTEGNDCVTVSAVDGNYYDILTLSADHQADLFTVDDPATFADTTGSNAIGSSFCWEVTCDHVRPEPYAVELTVLTERCFETDTIQFSMDISVQTTSDGSIQIVPNVFTPNDDEWNNEWELKHIDDVCRIGEQVRVFNRWGTVVFESTDLKDFWTGEVEESAVSDGQYLYIIDYSFLGKPFEYVGMVNVFK